MGFNGNPKFKGNPKDMPGKSIYFPKNIHDVLEKRYLLKDETGRVVEDPEGMFWRVARAVSMAETFYESDPLEVEREFYHLMSSMEFLPNSPTLMNAGTPMNQLSACFVLPVGDSVTEIFNALKYMALIHKSGGGVGFSFSKLRPCGDVVGSTAGIASGPLSFMRIFDVATDVIKQGGRRRGANMAVLSVHHPDILEFICAKNVPVEGEGSNPLENFNLSVAVDNEFMDKLAFDEDKHDNNLTGNLTKEGSPGSDKSKKKLNGSYYILNPRTNKIVGHLNAKEVFDLIVENAWRTGDPGILFMDEINRMNPTPASGKIEATNPCGEQPLLPYESCNLGSINLAGMVKNGTVNWNKLENTVKTAVHFLDNVLDVTNFPTSLIKTETLKNRKIGLGVMGFAEMLIMLNVPYDSDEAVETAVEVMKFIQDHSKKASEELGRSRGSFPNFKDSLWCKKGFKAMRNATTTTIAPTGTISIIANVTSGIEPLFAVSFIRNVMNGTELLEVNSLFEKTALERGFYTEEIMDAVACKGSIQDVDGIPEDVKRLFVTAHDIKPEWHVKMQAAFQRYVDNAVSKTVNLPHHTTKADVRRIFLMAYKLKCKGITVYRYGSKTEQVWYLKEFKGADLKPGEESKEYVSIDSEYSGGRPSNCCLH
ncbi:adenosylcobalamin-dependent ribonucleoside-diphosphate reductase [Methanobacterium congolense]|uniref:Vitamin B12-dependent ribonucleotide reductase n=1 Tax=Methanobacterium congolense TaxID=118062 RepID=A0A1D3L0X2_9EURY|nr:adenosylcobalamin-dependent ribonucleoside-diphosphate reductase [Methanobacterium congolense]SCG85139.1 Vitamin B12-dependent ribonucleoside-diphosphate reductase [Methanobacterium congolense]